VRDYGLASRRTDRHAFLRVRARGVRRRHYSGLGLGLILSARCSKPSAARIRVESQTGQGSTFWVELPLQTRTGPLDPKAV